jgi:hypothetical protein
MSAPCLCVCDLDETPRYLSIVIRIRIEEAILFLARVLEPRDVTAA